MNKYQIRFIILCFVSAILGASLAEFQYQKWQERKASDMQMIRDELAQPIVYESIAYKTEEVVDIGVIYEEVIEFQEMSEVERDDLIARVVEAEAGIEPFIGKVAVATVILNRMEANNLTAEEVIYSPNQFANPAKESSEESVRALELAERVRDLFPKNMTLFRNQHYHTFGTPYIQIGRHYFSLDPTLEVD